MYPCKKQVICKPFKHARAHTHTHTHTHTHRHTHSTAHGTQHTQLSACGARAYPVPAGPEVPPSAQAMAPSAKPKGPKMQPVGHHPLATRPPPSRGGSRAQQLKGSTASLASSNQPSMLSCSQPPHTPTAPQPASMHHAMRGADKVARHPSHTLYRPLTPSTSQYTLANQPLVPSRPCSTLPHASHNPLHTHQPHHHHALARSMHEGFADLSGAGAGRPAGALARPGSKSGRPTPPPSLTSTWSSASPRVQSRDPPRSTLQRPQQLSARRSNPLTSSSRLARQHLQPPPPQSLPLPPQSLLLPPPPRTPQPVPWQQHEAGRDGLAGPSLIPAFGGSLATSNWAMNRGSSASGGPRPPHGGGMQEALSGAGPNAFENDGRPGTRGGGTMFDLEG